MDYDSNILNQKLELIQWLSTIEDSSLIEKIMHLRNEETKDWWEVISEEEKQSIELGLDDIEAGRINPHLKARRIYEKWL
jgi:hypothetical protein